MQIITLEQPDRCATCETQLPAGARVSHNPLSGTVIHAYGMCPPEAFIARGICPTCRGTGRKQFMGLPSAAACDVCWGTKRPLSAEEWKALRPDWTYPPDCLGIPEEDAADEAMMRRNGLLIDPEG